MLQMRDSRQRFLKRLKVYLVVVCLFLSFQTPSLFRYRTLVVRLCGQYGNWGTWYASMLGLFEFTLSMKSSLSKDTRIA